MCVFEKLPDDNTRAFSRYKITTIQYVLYLIEENMILYSTPLEYNSDNSIIWSVIYLDND